MTRARRQPAAPRAGQTRSFLPAALGVLCVALLVRLVHVWRMSGTPYFSMLMGDARGYDTWAREIAAGGWIGREVFYQAPLYPYFIGVIYSVFGTDLATLRIAQALVGSLSCVLLGYAGLLWFSPPVGLAAGLTLALYAPAIFFDGIIQKSVLDVFFVCAALALLGWLHAGSADRRWRSAAWIALGVTIGCLSLTRENALVLIGVVAVWAFMRARQEATPIMARAGMPLLLFLLGVAVALVPVAARNYAVGGEVYLTTSQFGPNFYIGNNPAADGTYMSLRAGRGSPEYERLDATELAEQALGRRLTPGEVSGYWTDRALQFITTEPGTWLRLQARKVALLVNATEMLDTESQESHAEYSWPLRVLGPVVHFGVLVPLAVLGLWATWSDRRRLWLLYAVGLTYALSTVMFFVFARYRYPLTPVLLLFAAAGLIRVFEVRSVKRLPAACLAAVVLAAVLANWPLLSKDRMRAITETNLGTAFHEQGHFSEAVDRYRRAIAIQPDYAPAYNNLGVTLRAQGQVDAAIRTYEDGLRYREDYPDLHYNLANALLEQNRASEAAEHLRIASRDNPASAGVHNNLGKALAEKGQLVEAVTEFRRALAFEPGSAMTHRNLGNVLASLGRFDEGLTHLRRAVELDAKDAETRYDLGVLLLEGQRFAEAAGELRAAVAMRPGYIEALNNLGIALASQGRLDEAIAQWEEALRIEPSFEDARKNLELAKKSR